MKDAANSHKAILQMPKLQSVSAKNDATLDLVFEDGTVGTLDVSRFGFAGVFAAWRDKEVFRAARITPEGALAWGEEIELCPDALYLEITKTRPETLFPPLARADVNA